MPGFLSLAKEFFDQSARIAFPDYIGVRDPSYTAGVGILHYARYFLSRTSSTSVKEKSPHQKSALSVKKKGSSHTGVLEKVKNWLSEFI